MKIRRTTTGIEIQISFKEAEEIHEDTQNTWYAYDSIESTENSVLTKLDEVLGRMLGDPAVVLVCGVEKSR
jgi:hypothetical protein